jgi:DNA-binding IclR family transcriptional regulator
VAVGRALTLLAAFRAGKPQFSLAELAAASQQYKSTVLRLLASLEHLHLVQRQADGRYHARARRPMTCIEACSETGSCESIPPAGSA